MKLTAGKVLIIFIFQLPFYSCVQNEIKANDVEFITRNLADLDLTDSVGFARLKNDLSQKFSNVDQLVGTCPLRLVLEERDLSLFESVGYSREKMELIILNDTCEFMQMNESNNEQFLNNGILNQKYFNYYPWETKDLKQVSPSVYLMLSSRMRD